MNAKKLKRHVVASVLVAATMLGVVPLAQAAGYAVVVNQANGFSGSEQETRQMLKRLFLKQLTAWPDGSEAKVYAAAPASPAMQAFMGQVLEMSEAELASHWLSLKQKTGETPPREVGSDNILFKLVERYPGAFGIAGRDAAAGKEGVRVLLEMAP